MTVAKIAVSLPAVQAAFIRRAVASGRAASVSAYVAEAVAMRAREDTLADLVREMRAEAVVKPSRSDYAWADRALRPRRAPG